MSDVKRYTVVDVQLCAHYADSPDWMRYDDHIRAMRDAAILDTRALAEKDARIAKLERALREIVDHEPVFENQDPVEWGQEPCPGCERVREDKWPPSGLCEKHYAMVSRLTATNERHRNYQYIDMRRIARAALAPAHPTPAESEPPTAHVGTCGFCGREIEREARAISVAESAKCGTCGGSGLVRNPYPPPMRGMRLEPCPNGCAKPREEG